MSIPALITALIFIFILAPVVAAFVYSRKHAAKPTGRPPSADSLLYDKQYTVSVYAFPDTIQSIDDVKAKRMNTYRESGNISNFENDLIFERTFFPDGTTVYEIGKIIISAMEVSRMDATAVLYFFTRVASIPLRTQFAMTLMETMLHELKNGQTVMVYVKKVDAEQDEPDDSGASGKKE